MPDDEVKAGIDTSVEQAALLASMKRTINNAGGISNIGMLDDYWVQLRRYNFLQAQDKDKFSKSGKE